ncbi:hypothetical protein ACO0SA_001686 [Hanseniaspora valbyensis]
MSNQEKDVLDFLDSLPQKSSKSTNKTSLNKKKTTTAKKDNSVLDFLNELEEHNKKSGGSSKTDASSEAIEKESVEFIDTPKTETKETLSATEDTEKKIEEEQNQKEEKEQTENAAVSEEEGEKEADPISSFTSWFSNAATSKLGNVDSLINQTKSTLQKNLHSIQKPELDNLQQGFKNLLTQTINQIEEHVPDFEREGDDDDEEDEEENLKIYLQHDIPNWKFDKLCKETFYKILTSQVQDGVNINIKEILGDLPESQTFFEGKINDAEKLCLANIDDTIKRYKEETEASLVKESKIFISVVGVTVPIQEDSDVKELESVLDPSKEGNFSLIFILKDITNNIQIIQKSQSIPDKWIQWVLQYKKFEDKDIDPSKWVGEWIEQLIVLNFQILAQNYVIKRIKF